MSLDQALVAAVERAVAAALEQHDQRPPLVVGTAEAARLLSTSEDAVRDLVSAGELTRLDMSGRRVGRITITVSSIEDYCARADEQASQQLRAVEGAAA